MKTSAFCILHVGFAALLICFCNLCLKKEILILVAYLYISSQGGLSSHWSHGFVLVIVISVWLLNKVHAGMKLAGDTFSLGHPLWTWYS